MSSVRRGVCTPKTRRSCVAAEQQSNESRSHADAAASETATSWRAAEPSIECETLTERDGSVPSAFGEASGVPPPFTSKAQPHDTLDATLADFYATETSPEADEWRRRDGGGDGGDALDVSPLDAERRARLVQLRARLAEIEREAAVTVDIVDQPAIRDVVARLAVFDEELSMQRIEAERVAANVDIAGTGDDERDSAAANVAQKIVERVAVLTHEIDRVAGACRRRKAELNELRNQARGWERARAEIELWLSESSERLVGADRLPALDEIALQDELRVVDEVSDGFRSPVLRRANATRSLLAAKFKADKINKANIIK